MAVAELIATFWPEVIEVLLTFKSKPEPTPTVPSTAAVPPLLANRNHDAVDVLPAVAEPMALAVKTDGCAEDEAGANGVPQVCVESRTCAPTATSGVAGWEPS